MGFHHVAFATRDPEATHRFYSEVMGFELVHVNVTPTPGDHGGWSKHFFYSTGSGDDGSPDGGMIAFWDIHDTKIGDGFPVDINAMAGLPGWVNHVAYDAPTVEDLERHLRRWREHGQTVVDIDHGFCRSIYIRDPDNNMVEFCHTLRDFTPEERARAAAFVIDPSPPFDHEEAKITVHPPLTAAPTPA